MGNPQSIITLLTDFGQQDYFVGAMKGVILSINPDARIVDISHEIPPRDIDAAAFNLLSCYEDFPAQTVHAAVVDPGVGSDRRGIAIECAGQFFVGPDNGLFSWICEREKDWMAVHLTNRRFFRQPVSRTFHGRDIFAPFVAHLSNGTALSEFGEPVRDIVKLDSLAPKTINGNTIEGRIIHIDRFGNCVTNFSAEHLSSRATATSWKMLINDREIDSLRESFAEGKRNEIFCIVGSAGFLEISARNASAAELLGVRRGQKVQLISADLADIAARVG